MDDDTMKNIDKQIVKQLNELSNEENYPFFGSHSSDKVAVEGDKSRHNEVDLWGESIHCRLDRLLSSLDGPLMDENIYSKAIIDSIMNEEPRTLLVPNKAIAEKWEAGIKKMKAYLRGEVEISLLEAMVYGGGISSMDIHTESLLQTNEEEQNG